MKICPVGAKMFHAVRRTDIKLTVAFRNCVAAPDLATQVRDKCNTAVTLLNTHGSSDGKGDTHKQAFQGRAGVNHELQQTLVLRD